MYDHLLIPINGKKSEISIFKEIFPKVLNKHLNDKLIVILFIGVILMLTACNDEQSANSQTISTFRAFTGSPTRLVWVQDLLDNKDVVAEGNHLALLGDALKNQGYNLGHNYGLGKQHLSEVFVFLTMLAFLIDQIQ